MTARTSSRPSKKRGSPVPNDSDGDGATTAKRRRSHEEGDKENEDAQRPASPSPAAPPRAVARAERPSNDGIELKPPECGVIQRIYCENFMCHRKLTVDLNRNVNFIYGQNGSGKSAILAAIQICLGAGARRTHRARNLKELVRKDATCAAAKIRVTLLNKGDDAYEHDVYGDTITVERTIALRGGYNGYKLLDSKNQEQSRSKKDLDEMLDKLNIQVENPVAILDQEEAKKFLTGKAEDKYAFFMKATELERIDRTYAATVDKVNDLDSQSIRLNQTMEKDMLLVEDTKKQWEQHQEIEKLKRKLEGYREGYAWARHAASAEELKQQLEQQRIFLEKAEKKKDELTQIDAASQDGDTEELVKRNKLEELNREAEEQGKMKKALEQDLKRATEPQKGLERQLKQLKNNQASAERDLKQANHRLQEKRNEIMARAGSAESEDARRAQRLKEAEDKLTATKQKYEETKQAVSDALREYEGLEPHVEQARYNCNSAKSKLNAIEARIGSLESSSSNSVAMFGQKCNQVKKAVDNLVQQRRFKGPVLGPVGAYVKVVPGKEDFASIAELAIGNGALDRFIVTNDHDRKLFQNIRKQAGCQQECGVFQVSPHSRYNVPAPPVEGVETVASVLSVTDDLVFNCLVDNCKIDVSALARSREESEKLLLVETSNGRNQIRGKIKNVYCLPEGDYWAVRDGSITLVSNERKQLRQTIGVDKTAALVEARRDAQGVKEEMVEVKREESKLEHEHLENQKVWNVKKREMITIQIGINKLDEEIDSIKAEEHSAANFDTDTSEQEQDVTEADQAYDALKEQETSMKQEIEEKQPGIQELKARLDETMTRNRKVLDDMNAAQDDLTSYMQSLSQREQKIEKRRGKLTQLNQIIEKQEERITSIREDEQKVLKVARRLAFDRMMKKKRESEEVDDAEGVDSQFTQEPTEEELETVEIKDVDHDEAWYAVRVARAEKKIEQEKEKRNTTKEDAAAAYQKYHRAKKQLDGKMKQIQEVDKVSHDLKEDMTKRKQRWRQFRKHIANTTDMKFDEILNRKGSSGTVEFDHSSNQLDLVVQKDSGDANSQQKDVKALSGGERSFTTIALLLALGESLETPFRILDEFDIFLDPITRKLTIESLIEMAKGLPHRQFIFITPQDVSNVEVDPMLKVLKMTPPARTNVAGGPTQQTLDFSPSQS